MSDSLCSRVEAAYAALKKEIRERYPPSELVAITAGKVVASAATFPELETRLAALDIPTGRVAIDRVGHDALPFKEYGGWICMNAAIEHWAECLFPPAEGAVGGVEDHPTT